MKRLPLNLERAKAFHAGRKTRMWRLMKRQPSKGITSVELVDKDTYASYIDDLPCPIDFFKPPYLTGEICFIGEPWAEIEEEGHLLDGSPSGEFYKTILYQVDSNYHDINWRSPALMPEEFSRAKVRIVSCVPQRVQDVTEEEAKREGVEPYMQYFVKGKGIIPKYRVVFRDIIESIYPGAWENNLFGWAVEWERVEDAKV